MFGESPLNALKYRPRLKDAKWSAREFILAKLVDGIEKECEEATPQRIFYLYQEARRVAKFLGLGEPESLEGRAERTAILNVLRLKN